ncbi:sel1 repeat family protein [Acholeplasma sp. OttesenSCG-928-E16]|nr:sel1 repeat family protein [Acholeplasma sp. OttesenSCG-928-E16]
MIDQNLYEIYKKRIDDYDETVYFDALEAYGDGNTDMAYILGLCYILEMGTARNVKLGIKYLKEAALKHQNLDAIIALGDAYAGDFGNLIKSKFKEAKKYYELADQMGNLRGKSNLGNLFYTNHEYQKGFSLVKEAYDQGYQQDAWLLSRYYEIGKAVPKDDEAAFKIMMDIKNPGGYELVRIGRMYKNGIGTNIDAEQAFKYFSAAATLSFAVGMREVGLCFLLGFGTKRRIDLALKYLNLAADHGDFKSLDILVEINDLGDEKENYDFTTLPILSDDYIENIMRYLVVKNKLKFTKNNRQ